MKKKFSKAWKASGKPSKQRKYAANAPKHLKSRMMASHLSPELRKKYSRRSAKIRKSDKVKIMKGQFRGKSGKVESVDTKNMKVYISGIEFLKKDGGKSLYPINPSNLMIEELNTDDKKRMKNTGGKSS